MCLMQAVFLAAIIPKTGPEVVILYPEKFLSNDEVEELSLVCMPSGSTEGDFSSIVFNGYQVAGFLASTPPIDRELDSRDTIVSIGFLLDVYTNPIPYRNLLIDFVAKCSKNEFFTLDILKKIIPEFYKLKDNSNIEIRLSKEVICELSLEG